MTLKQKFENIDILFESQLLKLKYDENMNCADDCEKIADSYAVSFVDWLDLDETQDLIQSLQMVGELSKIPKTKELLEIFKKEKGL